jgi:hypothetical protein
MPDFSSLLKAHSGSVKKPPALPPGDYPAVITGWQCVEAPKGKEYTIIVRINIRLTGWPDSVGEEDRQVDGQPIDVAKKAMRRDYYNHRLFDIDALLDSCGISVDGTAYEELFPQLIGCPVTAEVAQYVSQKGEPGNQVNNLRPAG